MYLSLEPRIETWFPKLIYLVDGICTDEIPAYEKEIKKNKIETKRTQVLNVDSTHTKFRNLHKIKTFKNLSHQIETNAKTFLSYMGYSEDYTRKCHITDMWYNISNKEDYLFPHTHPGSILAGVFYVKTVDDNKIIFYDGNNNYEPPENITNLSMTTCEYQCIPGRLLLFRSDLSHATPKQDVDGEKIAISFNINRT
jgi:uncharacterized protein (TIGR02466 family)